MVVVGQIGCGYWGPNLLRNFSSHPGCIVKWVAEESLQRRIYVEETYPQVKTTDQWNDVTDDPEIDAVIIATPASTHFTLVNQALSRGKHVLVEKPLAMSTEEADQLVSASAKNNCVLMVGHTFLYNKAVNYLKDLCTQGDLGQIYYIYMQRLNLGQVRSDVNAWWNLAPHDISILLCLMNDVLPSSISAHGMSFIQPGIEDVVFATLSWPNQTIAHVHVSWLDPGRVRKATVVGSRKMVIYDDTSEDKITILDKGVDLIPKTGEILDYDRFDSYRLFQRTGDILIPRIDFQEPLKIQVNHFLDCIQTNKEPLTGPHHARDVVAILEAGQRSLRTNRTVFLS